MDVGECRLMNSQDAENQSVMDECSALFKIFISLLLQLRELQKRWNNVRTTDGERLRTVTWERQSPRKQEPTEAVRPTLSLPDWVCQQTGIDGELGGLPLTAEILVTGSLQGRTNY